MKKIVLVAGARPNFMKIAPILRELQLYRGEMTGILVHTGQHYDQSMSGTFFSALGINPPQYNLQVGSASHARQTAGVMMGFEEVCLKEKPDLVLVVGDVNSTIAAGLVAKKMHIHLGHVEAGLRSGDRGMPEEINRIATDAISDLFFTTEKEAMQNLLREGHPQNALHFVGHVMIDNLFFQLARLKTEGKSIISPHIQELKEVLPEKYICMTMHRPSNVDDKHTLKKLLTGIRKIAEQAPVVFPCHPRTRKNMQAFGLRSLLDENINKQKGQADSGIIVTEPLGFDDFLYLWKDAACVLTDSGGLQEETTALSIPCITMRRQTERPITTEVGSNEIVGDDIEKITRLTIKALSGQWKKSSIPDLWDGNAGSRIVQTVQRCL